jgi:hypothetical protein
MPWLYLAMDPALTSSAVSGSGKSYILVNQGFPNKGIPLKMTPEQAISAAMRCPTPTAKKAFTQATTWDITKVWLDLGEIGDLFMRHLVTWNADWCGVCIFTTLIMPAGTVAGSFGDTSLTYTLAFAACRKEAIACVQQLLTKLRATNQQAKEKYQIEWPQQTPRWWLQNRGYKVHMVSPGAETQEVQEPCRLCLAISGSPFYHDSGKLICEVCLLGVHLRWSQQSQ